MSVFTEYQAFGITLIVSIMALASVTILRVSKVIPTIVARKFMHILTGPVYILCWHMFPDTSLSRYLVAVVPLLLTAYFAAVGTAMVKDSNLVTTVSRSGTPAELLKGPLLYGIVHVASTVMYWRTSPVGIVALIILCVGDGVADLFGRRWGKSKLPWNPDKSWVGSAAFFFCSLAVAVFYSLLFIHWGYFTDKNVLILLAKVASITLSATVVESMSWADVDNLTVFAVCVVVGAVLW